MMKTLYEERFNLMLSALLRDIPSFECTFISSGNMFNCEVHVENEQAAKMVLLLTSFFDSYHYVVLKDTLTEDELAKYALFFKSSTAPFHSLITRVKDKKSGNSQLIGCVATSKEVNPSITDDWKEQLIHFIDNADVVPDVAPPLPPKGHKNKSLPPLPPQEQQEGPPPPLPPKKYEGYKKKDLPPCPQPEEIEQQEQYEEHNTEQNEYQTQTNM
ncbi:hypothetical protein EIN_086430 [Entamoeba invadens IP1]|uniref:hypothetical protein n=1 Tax=Entamoeba invadens IP1 TaxID=370355 RepID=UPI0002C3F60D|nr:hypothetical protein EIN_086430 [Entamoeba invadens IP1]ELP85371.1 hypothetical protein EIN_086430 [Entamoeba invadens IP1]|eukprot:XP_004184717.1 hypothetical protein EIN_086430 [Entamoeba invadens IP1]